MVLFNSMASSGLSTERSSYDADLAGDLPRRSLILGWSATTLFLVMLLGLGLMARLDAAVVARGKVVVLGNRRAVQSLDGGVISELHVREGDHVKAGQVLVRLEGGQAEASERALAAQVIQLEASQARLSAELSGQAHIDFPEGFKLAQGHELEDVAVAETLEQREFATRKSALRSSRALFLSKGIESEQQIEGYRRQVASNLEQQRLIHEEVQGLQGLLKQGLVPVTRVRALERSAAELSGNEGEYGADIARTRQEVGEARGRATDLDRQRAADDSRDYQAAQFQLAELEPKLKAFRDAVARTNVRSPANGHVVDLRVFTVGGVVEPAQKMMEIVPENEPLIVEANVKPEDVGELHVGQPVELRVSAFHDKGMPKILGRVSTISADAVPNDRSGASFFRVEVFVSAREAERIQQRRQDDKGLEPGLPVDLVIPTRHRTAIQYLFEPLSASLWKSFREH